MNSQGPIVAAVGFDDQTPALVDSALALAHRLARPLSFVHAHVESRELLGTAAYPAFAALSRAVAIDDELEHKRRRERMQSLLHSLASRRLATSGEVVLGPAPTAVMAAAAAQQASLIVTACTPGSYELTPRGLSVALTLMATSELPVLAVSAKARLTLPTDRRFRVLVCDDLEPGSLPAVEAALDWAGRLRDVDVTQVHVHGDMREILRDYWQDLVASTPYLRDHFADSEELWQDHEAQRQRCLADRGAAAAERAIAAGASISRQCRFANDVQAELQLAVEDVAPDLIVFGRHQTLKTRPFLLGRMPLRAMVAFERPVLVVPPPEKGDS